MPTPWNHIFQRKRVLERISAAQFASNKQISCFDGSGFSTSHTIVSAPASSIQSRPPLFFLCVVTLFPARAFCWERADHTANAGAENKAVVGESCYRWRHSNSAPPTGCSCLLSDIYWRIALNPVWKYLHLRVLDYSHLITFWKRVQ